MGLPLLCRLWSPSCSIRFLKNKKFSVILSNTFLVNYNTYYAHRKRYKKFKNQSLKIGAHQY